MKKVDVLNRIEKAGIVAVVREASKEQALQAAEAVIKGGIKGIEVTFSVPHADQVIAELKKNHEAEAAVIIGAGTVLEAVTARLAILAGAEFIVSPCFDQETAELCNLYQLAESIWIICQSGSKLEHSLWVWAAIYLKV